MCKPSFYPGSPQKIELIETHISWVFLAGDRAYKVRKPVVMPFLDYSSLSRRRHMAEEEVRLGRRLAPDIYLGVLGIFSTASGLTLQGEAEAVEYAVEMRRFSMEQTLDARLQKGDVEPGLVRSLGARIAAFHRSEEPITPGWGPEDVFRAVEDNFASLSEMEPDPALARRMHSGHRFAVAFLDHRRDLLAARARQSVRDGHGDLRAEHVVFGDKVQVFDPVEFNPSLREIDVSADLAFLVMDLERYGRGDLTAELLAGYRESGGDPGEDSLVFFYAAYRAWVRAKVAWLRACQGGLSSSHLAEVDSLAELAERLAWRARSPLALVICGPAASGKTHLAERLHHGLGLAHLSSDVVRKGMLGLAAEQTAPPEAYTEDWNRRTYAEIGRRAAAVARRGRGVIVDATFRFRADREVFASAFGGEHLPLFVECRAPATVLAARAESRAGHLEQASDAGAAVALRQNQSFEALDEIPARRHVVLRTDRPVAWVTDELEATLDERLLAP